MSHKITFNGNESKQESEKIYLTETKTQLHFQERHSEQKLRITVVAMLNEKQGFRKKETQTMVVAHRK